MNDYVVGVIIMALVVGNLTSAVWGWAVIGIACLISAAVEHFEKMHKRDIAETRGKK